MKNKTNPAKIDKKIIRFILAAVVLVVFISIIILLNSLLNKKQSSLDNIGYSFGKSHSDLHRKIIIESKDEGIFNMGEYRVNITPNRLLTLNLSIKCQNDAYTTLLKNNIALQNAVIGAFDMYGGIHFLDTPSGKDRLKSKIKQNMSDALGKPLVEEIYFNKYLIH
jgi:flagellar basal body-associated protein FliL